MDDNDQGFDDQGYWAYQQEIEHRRFLEETNQENTDD